MLYRYLFNFECIIILSLRWNILLTVMSYIIKSEADLLSVYIPSYDIFIDQLKNTLIMWWIAPILKYLLKWKPILVFMVKSPVSCNTIICLSRTSTSNKSNLRWLVVSFSDSWYSWYICHMVQWNVLKVCTEMVVWPMNTVHHFSFTMVVHVNSH